MGINGKITDGARGAVIDQRSRVAFGGMVSGHLPMGIRAAEELHRLAGQYADGKTVERDLQSHTRSFQIGFFARPAIEKSLNARFRRQRSQISHLASRE